MAHTRTTDDDARMLEQCSRGRRVRYIYNCQILMAVDRTNEPVADCIDGETVNKAIFVAPCDGKVVRVYANAKAFPTTSGAATVKATKAVISGSDVDLCSTIDLDNPTDETAIDGTLSTTSGALDLVEGQLVYAVLALSATTSADGEGMIVCVEFVPTDTPT